VKGKVPVRRFARFRQIRCLSLAIFGLSSAAHAVCVDYSLSPHGLVGSPGGYGEATDAERIGDLVYVSTIADHSVNGFVIVDIADPLAPETLSVIPVPTVFAYGIAAAGDYAYVAASTSDVIIIDVSIPTSPSVTDSIQRPGGAFDTDIDNGVLYIAGGAGLNLNDLTDPANPVEISSVGDLGNAYEVEVQGGLAFVSSFDGLLRVVDVSDPLLPSHVGTLDLGGRASFQRVGDILYTSVGGVGLRVVAVSVPSAPSVVGELLTGSGGKCSVQGDRVLLSGVPQVAPFPLIDVSDPTAPRS
jgi:hypothetical protein